MCVLTQSGSYFHILVPCCCFFLYNYKELKYPRIQCYESERKHMTTCTPTIIEVQLGISEKVQAILYTNKFL